MLVSLCAWAINPVFEGDVKQNLTAVEGNLSAYYRVYPESRITGEGWAEFLRAWGINNKRSPIQDDFEPTPESTQFIVVAFKGESSRSLHRGDRHTIYSV